MSSKYSQDHFKLAKITCCHGPVCIHSVWVKKEFGLAICNLSNNLWTHYMHGQLICQECKTHYSISLANQVCYLLIHVYKNNKCVVSQECQTILLYSIWLDRWCPNHTPGSHSVCTVGTLLGVIQKILSTEGNPSWMVFYFKCLDHLASQWK